MWKGHKVPKLYTLDLELFPWEGLWSLRVHYESLSLATLTRGTFSSPVVSSSGCLALSMQP